MFRSVPIALCVPSELSTNALQHAQNSQEPFPSIFFQIHHCKPRSVSIISQQKPLIALFQPIVRLQHALRHKTINGGVVGDSTKLACML